MQKRNRRGQETRTQQDESQSGMMNEHDAKILKDLASAINGLRNEIQVISKIQQPAKSKHSDKPVRVDVQTATGLPVTVREYYKSKESENRWDLWKKIKNGIEILAIATAIIVAVLTWRTLQKVKEQATSAQRQVELTQKQLEADERAWLKVSGYKFPPLNTVTVARLTVSNIGKSIAQQVDARDYFEVRGAFEIVDRRNAPSFNLSNPSAVILPLLFPGDHNDDLQIGVPRSFTAPEIQNFTTGRTYFSVFGYIAYRDQFGKHWTRFCSWSYYPGLSPDKTANAVSCESYNAVGDGDLPK